MILPKRDAMKLFKKENGHTLLELVVVLGMVGMLLLVVWSSYLSIHRAYIRADKKAQNLEEARLIINHITDNFQIYGGCEVITEGPALGGFATVKEVIFNEYSSNPADPDTLIKVPAATIAYESGTLKWRKNTSVEIENEVSSFKVKKEGNLLEFKIEVIKEGHGVIADQILEVGTTLSLKYMPTI